MLGCFCLAELDLVNKIQFTFEVVPCLILGLFKRFFHRCASILAHAALQGGWWGVGREKENLPGEDTGPPVALRWS